MPKQEILHCFAPTAKSLHDTMRIISLTHRIEQVVPIPDESVYILVTTLYSELLKTY